ncbi:MAG: sulfur carrier protein ThiS [Chloroflexi bacterium]|nr:sulfur carrier protein ThiS [Chloroflexota bacterium]
MIALQVNGKERKVETPVSLLAFVESLNIGKGRFAVAHNGVVLRKDELQNVTLQDGDAVEIVRAVGGG